MKNATIWGALALFTILLSATAFAAELSDTKIDYFDYREVAPGEAGAVYKIQLTNNGNATRTYELIPDLDAVRSVGTYRVEPSTKVTLKANESKTLYFYLALERGVEGRLSIPVKITSGDQKSTIELAARSTKEAPAANQNWLSQVLKVAFFTMIVLIFLTLIITLFRKGRKKREEKEEGESAEVQTYY